jgi:hypothetical protein
MATGISGVQQEMATGISGVQQEMATGISGVQQEMATGISGCCDSGKQRNENMKLQQRGLRTYTSINTHTYEHIHTSMHTFT